ncbi:unnamed protein product [Lupinus luteus]|uniref:SBP-type domain-containing protein n=1 Tax=Lupinus luteus TaxID=3873 RepID=A0AAV1Y7G5_LUPLU
MMLDYESYMKLTPNQDGSSSSSDQAHRQIYDHYTPHNFDYFLHGPGPTNTTTTTTATHFSHHQLHFDPQQAHPTFLHTPAYHGPASPSYPPPMARTLDFVGSRLGLNLGGQTYFLSSQDNFVSQLYQRSRPAELGSTVMSNSPRCQVEGCNADLSQAKHYHRRHKVCEYHSKASTVIAAGLTQRFCQQCSRFHVISEFDNGKRSCRKRLADHNRRRRKTQQPTQDTFSNVARFPSDSRAQSSSSSVIVAVSPPDYFWQRPYHSTSTSTT